MPTNAIVAAAAGMISIVTVFVAMIKFFIMLNVQVERHEQKLDKDFENLEILKSRDDIILHALLAIINHDIDGNGIKELKSIRARIIEKISLK